MGPLAAAVAPGRLAVLDSFGGRLLVWSWDGRNWRGPAVHRLPTRAPLVALALAPAGGSLLAAVADGAGTVWELSAGAPPRRALVLPNAPGDLRRIVSLSALGGGEVVADVVEVGARRSSRYLVAIPAAGAPRRFLEADVAGVARSSPPVPERLLAPAGVRLAVAAGGGRSVWVVAVAPSGAELVRAGLDGRVLGRRPWPQLARPADLLAVGRGGVGYALSGVGTADERVVAFGRSGAIHRALAVAPGPGPRLPHPAAADDLGAVVLLTSGQHALHVRWIPPGGLPRA